MAKRYEISAEQKAEIEAARRTNKSKRVEARLRVLVLRAEGRKLEEIAETVGFHYATVSAIVSKYMHSGLKAVMDERYGGNHRNMTYEEEEALLAPFLQQAENGQIISVSEMAAAYQAAIGHTVGKNQIYYVLRRHGWRKVMPRSRHPKKASEEVIATSKKLTLESES